MLCSPPAFTLGSITYLSGFSEAPLCVCPQVVLWMSFKKWLFYMICHGICSNKSFFYHVATGRCLSPWTHFSSGGVWGGRGPPATGRFMPGSPFLVCCCCCEVASVVSDSVRPHRRQPTRLPPSLGFSRQEHWSGFLVWKSCFNLQVRRTAVQTRCHQRATWARKQSWEMSAVCFGKKRYSSHAVMQRPRAPFTAGPAVAGAQEGLRPWVLGVCCSQSVPLLRAQRGL